MPPRPRPAEPNDYAGGQVTRTTLPLFGTDDKTVRLADEDGLWIELLVRPTGERICWDCCVVFENQAAAVEWLEQVEHLAVDAPPVEQPQSASDCAQVGTQWPHVIEQPVAPSKPMQQQSTRAPTQASLSSGYLPAERLPRRRWPLNPPE